MSEEIAALVESLRKRLLYVSFDAQGIEEKRYCDVCDSSWIGAIEYHTEDCPLAALKALSLNNGDRLNTLRALLERAEKALKSIDQMAVNVVYNLDQLKRDMTQEEVSRFVSDLRAAASIQAEIKEALK